MKNNYKEFANYYDMYMEEETYTDWFEYLRQLSGIEIFSSKEILDLCCGTGILSLYFAKLKARVTGVDISKDMLKIADERAFNNKVRFNLICSDAVKFKSSKKFDFIYSACDSLNYISAKEELLLLFNNIYSLLKDNSVFTFDYITKENLYNIEKEELFEIGGFVFFVSRIIEDDVLNTKIDIIKDGEIKEKLTHMQTCFSGIEIEEIINQSAFSNCLKYDFLEFNVPNENSEKIQYVLRK